MICIWMKDSPPHVNSHLDVNPRRGAQCWAWGEGAENFWGEGRCYTTWGTSLVREQDWVKPLILPFWKFCKGLYPEDVGRLTTCCQGSWVYVNILPFISKIILGSPTRRLSGSLPAVGDHYFTCANSAWECVSFLTTDHILSVTRHPGKSGISLLGMRSLGAAHVKFIFACS